MGSENERKYPYRFGPELTGAELDARIGRQN